MGTTTGAGGATTTSTTSSTSTGGGSVMGPLRVQYAAGDTNPTDNQVRAHLDLINDSTSTVNLVDVTLRYWFTLEPGTTTMQFNCDYAMMGCGVLTSSFGVTSGANADHYLEIGFTGGTLGPGQSTGPIQARFHKTDYTTLDENNDYSFDANKTSFTDHPAVGAFGNGILAWGAEP